MNRLSVSRDRTDIMGYDFADAIEHGTIVSELSVLVAKCLGMDEDFCNDIAIAAMLHDIGKLRLSEHLHKERSEAMVVEKMKYVRMHATFSRDIMKEHGYADNLLDMVYHHHENYDGSGYPSNISGEDIPLGARIIRVCDVFAALVSDRSYRKAFSENVAIELMIEEERHFDMKVFLAFLEVIHSDDYNRVRRLMHGDIAACVVSYYQDNIDM